MQRCGMHGLQCICLGTDSLHPSASLRLIRHRAWPFVSNHIRSRMVMRDVRHSIQKQQFASQVVLLCHRLNRFRARRLQLLNGRCRVFDGSRRRLESLGHPRPLAHHHAAASPRFTRRNKPMRIGVTSAEHLCAAEYHSCLNSAICRGRTFDFCKEAPPLGTNMLAEMCGDGAFRK